MGAPLRVLVVEDEALLAMQLEMFLEDAGHVVVGAAASSGEAKALAGACEADLALVDVHLDDGPTGCEVGRHIAETTGTVVVFMTANPKRIPDDFSGAVGVIAKPYSQRGLQLALDYLVYAVRGPPSQAQLPSSLTLAPSFEERWQAGLRPKT